MARNNQVRSQRKLPISSIPSEKLEELARRRAGNTIKERKVLEKIRQHRDTIREGNNSTYRNIYKDRRTIERFKGGSRFTRIDDSQNFKGGSSFTWIDDPQNALRTIENVALPNTRPNQTFSNNRPNPAFYFTDEVYVKFLDAVINMKKR